MFVRRKANGLGRLRYQLVHSTRSGRTVRQHVLVDLGQAPTVDTALRQWPRQVTQLRQRAAELRSAAEGMRAKMPPIWLEAGMVPRPGRWGMRAANRACSEYWSVWNRAGTLDRAADRLQLRLDRLRDIVKHELGTTSVDDEALDLGA